MIGLDLTAEPNVAIADWRSSGQVLTNGNAYEMSYATFVTFQEGLLVTYREYWNPRAFWSVSLLPGA